MTYSIGGDASSYHGLQLWSRLMQSKHWCTASDSHMTSEPGRSSLSKTFYHWPALVLNGQSEQRCNGRGQAWYKGIRWWTTAPSIHSQDIIIIWTAHTPGDMISDPGIKTRCYYHTALFQLGENQSILFSERVWLKKLRWYYVLWFSPVIRWAFTLYCAHKDTWCSSITLRAPAPHLSHVWFNRVSRTIILPNDTLTGPSFIQLNIQYASIGELPN